MTNKNNNNNILVFDMMKSREDKIKIGLIKQLLSLSIKVKLLGCFPVAFRTNMPGAPMTSGWRLERIGVSIVHSHVK